MMETFIFEITDFEPTYRFSVNRLKFVESAWREHSKVAMTAVCLLPKKVAGRSATFELAAGRDVWVPPEWQRDHRWRPSDVGLLELPPTAGRFHGAIPHDSMAALMTALAHGLYRYILLDGPPLWRGGSLCQSMHFLRTINLDDY